LLAISGKFNCLSGDIIFFVASEADIDRWSLTGVSSFLVVMRSLVHAAHLKVDLPEELRNTWSLSQICTHEQWKRRSHTPQGMVFCFLEKGFSQTAHNSLLAAIS
jgi:hypothetical protein